MVHAGFFLTKCTDKKCFSLDTTECVYINDPPTHTRLCVSTMDNILWGAYALNVFCLELKSP